MNNNRMSFIRVFHIRTIAWQHIWPQGSIIVSPTFPRMPREPTDSGYGRYNEAKLRQGIHSGQVVNPIFTLTLTPVDNQETPVGKPIVDTSIRNLSPLSHSARPGFNCSLHILHTQRFGE